VAIVPIYFFTVTKMAGRSCSLQKNEKKEVQMITITILKRLKGCETI
jgi:hypothetical protein